MSKIISVIGIVFVMIGTIFSLLSVLGTKVKEVGTAGKEDRKQKDFKKDKRNVIIGIILGSILQMLGIFI
ncbi:MAG: hypothetical protein NC416_01260 [Eubacterium sp.]|nr:hypothetical protein [Eubacterium sp.]